MWKVRDFRELILRCIFVVIFMGVILGISLNKIRVAFGFEDVDPLVSVTIRPPKVFPVWSSFMCGQNITKLTVEKLNKVINKAELLPDHYISRTTTDSLAAGDWTLQTGPWPCFVFKPGNDIFFISGDIDQIILSAFVDEGMPVNSQSGLLFGIFDEQRNISMVEPFVSPTPSVNTFTFTRSQRIDVNEKLHSYFSVNKQNISPIFGGFDAKTMVAKFLYSPDTYLVFTFTEKRPYTPYDLLSAVGGLLTYSLAVWFILFGRGKYRSWGLVQRYLLRTSPDAMKKDDGDQLLSIPYDNTKDLEKQLSDGSTARRQHSLYYFSATGTPTQQNFSPSTTNSILASPSGKNLNKIIDARVNQKLWIVEQTLSRHYLSGFRLRSYDVDVKKFGYDGDDVTDNETLTPPTVHRNWNDVDSGGRGFGNPQMFPRGSQHLQKNHNNVPDSSNPEEQRPQYPIVTIGQVPSEKKHKGTASTSEIETAVISDGNNISNESSSTSAPSPSYLPDIPIQLQPRSNLA